MKFIKSTFALSAFFFATTTYSQEAKEITPEQEAMMNMQMGMAGLNQASNDPVLLAQLMKDLQNPEMMAEAKKMMDSPSFQKQMKKLSETPDFKDNMKKSSTFFYFLFTLGSTSPISLQLTYNIIISSSFITQPLHLSPSNYFLTRNKSI